MASNATVKCPAPMKATSNGAFQGDDPLHFALPLAILQIVLVVVLSRVIAYLLRPLRRLILSSTLYMQNLDLLKPVQRDNRLYEINNLFLLDGEHIVICKFKEFFMDDMLYVFREEFCLVPLL